MTVNGQELWIERASSPLTRDDNNNKALRELGGEFHLPVLAER